ncbi:MAG: methyltransferase domain-containing protein [Methanobacteriota archaeon]
MTVQNPYVFNSIANVYDSTRSLPQDVMAQVVESLFRQLGGSERVLEVGVGTGRFAAPLSRMGLKIIGVDLAVGMMARARAKGFNNLVLASATDLPFCDKSFDAALMVHLLHLIPDWRRALVEIGRATSGSLFTVAMEREKYHEPRAIYEKRLGELGYGPAFLGLHERKLASLLKPDDIWPVCEFEETLGTDEMIGTIERREYSWATRMPDDLHCTVIREMRERCGDTTESVSNSMKVYRWDAERLSSIPE